MWFAALFSDRALPVIRPKKSKHGRIKVEKKSITHKLKVAKLFVGDNHGRKRLFVKFSKYHVPMKSVFAPKATQCKIISPRSYYDVIVGESVFGFKIKRPVQ